MSRGREPSYYEIALTQRQVVIAFVIVLLCLVAAFFSGVWVGGESVRNRSAEPVAQTAQTESGGAADTQPVAPPAGEEESGPPTLRFFTEDEAGADSPANRVKPPATGAQAGDAPPPRPQPAAPQQASAEPAPSAAQPTTKPKAPIGGQPRYRPPAPRPKPSATQEPPSPPTTTVPGQGKPVIQVFSSHDQAQAQKVLDRLLRADYDAFLSPAEVDGIVRFRVRVGPFESRDQAERVAEDLRRDLKLETWITQ